MRGCSCPQQGSGAGAELDLLPLPSLPAGQEMEICMPWCRKGVRTPSPAPRAKGTGWHPGKCSSEVSRCLSKTGTACNGARWWPKGTTFLHGWVTHGGIALIITISDELSVPCHVTHFQNHGRKYIFQINQAGLRLRAAPRHCPASPGMA